VTHPLAPLAAELAAGAVRYVLIGVSAANMYGPHGQAVFTTKDFDLFVPPEPDNLARSWEACERAGLDLWIGGEPLGPPTRSMARRAFRRTARPDARDRPR
jgi:hypothetical protein